MARSGVLGIGLFLAAFAYFLRGLAPSVTVGDSGEFITAACTLGITHPPAFPAYTILGKFISHLVPFANPAYGINLFSALAGAATVVFLFCAGVSGGLNRGASAAGALLFGLAPALAASSQTSEVFAL